MKVAGLSHDQRTPDIRLSLSPRNYIGSDLNIIIKALAYPNETSNSHHEYPWSKTSWILEGYIYIHHLLL